MLPFAVDYELVYSPASLTLLGGLNPFSVPGFYNPPWILALLIPFVVLGSWGRGLFMLISLGCLVFTSYKLGASRWGVLAIALSPLAFDSLVWGNVDSIVLLGLVLPLPLGLILLAIKPQMTWGVMLFLIIRVWREKGRIEAAKTLFPVVGLFVVSILLYGFYPNHWMDYSAEAGLNLSFFPYTIPLGLVLLYYAFKTNRIGFAIAASPMFFQTICPPVWIVELVAIASLTREVCLASVSTWGVIMFARTRMV